MEVKGGEATNRIGQDLSIKKIIETEEGLEVPEVIVATTLLDGGLITETREKRLRGASDLQKSEIEVLRGDQQDLTTDLEDREVIPEVDLGEKFSKRLGIWSRVIKNYGRVLIIQ